MSNVVPLRPADGDVLAATVEAIRLLGEGSAAPTSMIASRARKVVTAAAHEVFPRLSWREIGRLVGGYSDLDEVQALVRLARDERWWSDSIVEQVVGELYARYIPERT